MTALAILCLVLALWMTGSRSAADHRAGSLDSGSRWDRAYYAITDQALQYRKSGDLRAAEDLYRRGTEEATRRGDKLAEIRFLISLGGCEVLRFQYRPALSALLAARVRALAIQDTVDLGAIALNISSIYLQMWDIPAAQRAAEEGLETTATLPGSYALPHLLLELGRIHSLIKDDLAESFYIKGREAARRTHDQQTEARAWDWLGDEQFSRDALGDAEKSYIQAYQLRIATHSSELGFSYGRLGALRLAQGRLQEADRLTQLALKSARDGRPGWPDYLMLHQQGSVHLAQGAVDAALADFSHAIDSTAEWRLNVLPTRSSLTSANIGMEDRIFRSFIELAADQAVRSHSVVWSQRAFQALELNRAASLRETLSLTDVWREKLPPEYWETVAQLESAQANALRIGKNDRTIPSLRLKITEMEARAGLSFAVKKAENFRIQTSLNHFQAGLGESEIYLAFLLGRDSSYLWAVSRDGLHVYRLASERVIAEHVAAFREALLAADVRSSTRQTEWERQGRRLYEDLFGSLSDGERSKKTWLLSLEGVLFEAPFAALVERGGQTEYAVERHSMQSVPGALMLEEPAHRVRRRGLFLGVGDPVYNAADLRWRSQSTAIRTIANRDEPNREQLTRLVASGDEVRTSADSWRRQSGTAAILEGFQAGREAFLAKLASEPQVIHLATHIVFPQQKLGGMSREQAFVAFSIPSITQNDAPQFLTTARISTLHVPGALVVMTGCATGTGDARAGAGLLGLTRAWLMAGASGVLSTAWPVEDSSGEIFSRFYQYYPEAPAAEALRRSQVEMLHRTAPSQWASYQLTGGLR